MGCDDNRMGQKLFRIETVRGEPFYIGGRKLTPVARIIAFGKASGTIGTRRVSGWGGGYVRVTPLAVLEDTDDGERRIAIYDTKAASVQRLCAAALAFTLFFATVRWWAHRRQARSN
jgi:uncharacterized spore protein YtfJ